MFLRATYPYLYIGLQNLPSAYTNVNPYTNLEYNLENQNPEVERNRFGNP